ncbi:uncharacterized protein LY79DRAFT_562370 [Colletotrichum navitas]|uniref:Uncharacterized protein n=1 Tax=Colletotrichum navitas TaxID=681940 RepID=A0AAD8PSU8_9PEZI|nr:uncharacterized protein LY79DRAFT_562370 [Colletotrichum navitas]KAK1580128.1 hypothetical protein LY79DRAFT_562370 [Colletotrichum navitas]
MYSHQRQIAAFTRLPRALPRLSEEEAYIGGLQFQDMRLDVSDKMASESGLDNIPETNQLVPLVPPFALSLLPMIYNPGQVLTGCRCPRVLMPGNFRSFLMPISTLKMTDSSSAHWQPYPAITHAATGEGLMENMRAIFRGENNTLHPDATLEESTACNQQRSVITNGSQRIGSHS